MADALGQDRLEVGPKGRVGVTLREERLADVGDRGTRVAENRGPLLDLLKEVLDENSGIAARSLSAAASSLEGRAGLNLHSTVPGLDLGASAGEARESVEDQLCLRPVRQPTEQISVIGPQDSPTAGQS